MDLSKVDKEKKEVLWRRNHQAAAGTKETFPCESRRGEVKVAV
jgi:hypothetical protein